MVKVDQLRIAE